jgi:hypothetical protein
MRGTSCRGLERISPASPSTRVPVWIGLQAASSLHVPPPEREEVPVVATGTFQAEAKFDGQPTVMPIEEGAMTDS